MALLSSILLLINIADDKLISYSVVGASLFFLSFNQESGGIYLFVTMVNRSWALLCVLHVPEYDG